MKKIEAVNLAKYLYYLESRLQNDVESYEIRYFRRQFDSVDLLEEIIAKEKLKFFYLIEEDIIKILKLNNDDTDLRL